MSGLFGGGVQDVVTRQPRLAGVQLQTSSYGAPMGLWYGENRATGNLVWYGNFQAIEQRSEQSSGGKGGGGGKSTSISYTYRAGFIFSIGEGLANITHIMPDAESFKTPAQLGIETFNGALGQPVWGELTANHPDKAISYSGLAGFRAASYDLGSSANMPNFSVKLIGQPQITTRLSGYIRHFSIDNVAGVGFPEVRLAGLDAVENYLASQDVQFSPFAIEKKPAAEYLREWCHMANIETVWSEGLLKFNPRYDSAGVVAELGIDDFIVSGNEPPVVMTRTDPADAFNSLRINYLDASNDYNTSSADFKDQANIDRFGLRPASEETYFAVKSADVAAWVLEHRGKRNLYVRNEYTFNLGWQFARLEPMDVVTLTEPRLGLNGDAVMIKEITENETGDLTIVAEEYNGLVSGVVDKAPIQVPVGGGIDQGVSPGNANAPMIFQPPPALIPSGPEIWLAVSGGADWGGCEIWASLDDTSYRRIGIQTGSARHGTLRSALPSGVSPDITNTLAVNTLSGELLSGTTQDATDLLTLLIVDNEMMSYRDSNLVGVNNYDLTYLVRGAYGSSIASHANGVKWARVDEKIFKYQVPADWYGRTIYIKFVSFNKFGLNNQSIADVSAYSYTIAGDQPAALTGLSATAFQTTIQIGWITPTNIDALARIDVLRSETNDFTTAQLIESVTPNVPSIADTIGVSGATRHYWVRAISVHGDAGIVTGPVSATTGSVGGITILTDPSDISTTPEAGNEVVYSNASKTIWVWDPASSSYKNTADLGNSYYNLVAATKAAFGNLSAISADLGSITSGNITLGNTSYIKGGQTAYNVGNGFFLGYESGFYKFSVGNATQGFTWDGSAATIKGDLIGTGNIKLNGVTVTLGANSQLIDVAPNAQILTITVNSDTVGSTLFISCVSSFHATYPDGVSRATYFNLERSVNGGAFQTIGSSSLTYGIPAFTTDGIQQTDFLPSICITLSLIDYPPSGILTYRIVSKRTVGAGVVRHQNNSLTLLNLKR
jgi:hypothetical protein